MTKASIRGSFCKSKKGVEVHFTMVTKIEPERVIKSLGGKAKIKIRFEQHRENMEYLQTHYAQLKEKYPDHWIAVHHRKVIATENNPERLLEMLSKVRARDVLLYYIPEREESMIL